MVLNLNPIQECGILTLFRAAYGWGQKEPLPKICRKYPTMIKLGIIIPYLKKFQKIYKLRVIPVESAGISILSTEIKMFCFIKKYRYRLHFNT